MDHLMTLLRAGLDDDERVARAAGGGVWTRECGHIGMEDEDLPPGHDLCAVVAGDIHIYDEGGHTPNQAEHIARHDPARVLAEVDAKRHLIDEVFRYEAEIDGEWGDGHTAEQIAAGECPERRPDDIPAIRLLALPYVRAALDEHLTEHGCGTGDHQSRNYVGGFINCPEAKALWDLLPASAQITMG